METPLTEIVFEDGFDAVPCTEADEGCPTAIELERLRQAVMDGLAGVCVGQEHVGDSFVGFDYCYETSGACNGCRLTSSVPSLEVAAAGLGRATVDVVFDVSGIIPVDGSISFSPFNCDLHVVASQQQRLRSEVAYQLDAETGQYTVTSDTRTISPTFDGWQLSNCAQISALGGLVDDMLDAVAGEYLVQTASLVGLKF